MKPAIKAVLEVETPLLELEEKIKELKTVNQSGKIDLSREIEALERKAAQLKKSIYENLSPWEKVLLARHPERPNTLEYIQAMCTDFFELHGDRLHADDAAIVGGFARLEGRPVMVIGHQKGRETRENLARNFGMANPEGFRKAGRLMRLAASFRIPILTFIDTPGAYPGIEAEERGQYEAIATNIALMTSLPVPIIVTVIGEGGSGGALAIGVGDRVLMLEHSVYSVISPEGCASILWRDAGKAQDAARALRLTAQDLLRLGVVDTVLSEPLGGVHRDPEQVYRKLSGFLQEELEALGALPQETLLERRYQKYRKMGEFAIAEGAQRTHSPV
ncbi:MAG: acetyl-CoA carboxylase carboxyltransferase subunit alpha [Armatimonadetes bacterium]|nr:acetyl-CoA carboxylase carboxyltransferase subunit alpha [Armatimonadota bacterium]